MTIAVLLHDLESAQSGSRELSDRVLLAMGWEPDNLIFEGNRGWFHPVTLARMYGTPSPTESVDWLLANVPMGLMITDVGRNPDGPRWFWEIKHAKGWETAECSTLALALCAAILRAMVAEGRITESV